MSSFFCSPSFFDKSDSISWNPSPFVLLGQRGGGWRVGGSKGLFPCRALVGRGCCACVCFLSAKGNCISMHYPAGRGHRRRAVSLSILPLEQTQSWTQRSPITLCMDLHWINPIYLFDYLWFIYCLEPWMRTRSTMHSRVKSRSCDNYLSIKVSVWHRSRITQVSVLCFQLNFKKALDCDCPLKQGNVFPYSRVIIINST